MSNALSLAFVAAGIDAATVKPKAIRKPKASIPKASKPKASAADKEGAAQTRRDIVAAATGKAASKSFKVSPAAKASLARARTGIVTTSAALQHALKLAGGKTEVYRAAMAKAYGPDWHVCKARNAETEADKARATLIDMERVTLQTACEAAKMSNPRKPWSDAGKAQASYLEADALKKAGIDPAKKGKRAERSLEERIKLACLPLYAAHQKNPADSSDKAADAIALLGKALILLGQDLTQANLAGNN